MLDIPEICSNFKEALLAGSLESLLAPESWVLMQKAYAWDTVLMISAKTGREGTSTPPP